MLVLHSMCKGFLKFQDHESFDYVNQTVEKELWCDTWHLCGAKSLFGHSWRVSLRCQYIAFSLHLCRRLFFGCQLACSPLIATTLWALIISRQKNCRLDNLVLSELPPESFMIYIYYKMMHYIMYYNVVSCSLCQNHSAWLISWHDVLLVSCANQLQ